MEKTIDDRLSARDHKRVSDFIDAVTGIQLPESKRSLIEGRLRKRQRILGLDSLHAYIEFVLDSGEGASEKPHLLDVITTNKTDFYREKDHFRFLRQYLMQSMSPGGFLRRQQPFRIWSAGCSSGEEPYTLAFEMLEIAQQYSEFNFEIHATDISMSCLKTAARGIYSHDRIEPMPMALRKKYLLKSKNPADNLVRIAPEVRNRVKFFEFNLLTGQYAPGRTYDVIFCRNVMIYFSEEGRRKVVALFHQSLSEDGILFVGHSESLANKTSLFSQIQPTVYRRISTRAYAGAGI